MGHYFWKIIFLLWLVAGLVQSTFGYGACDYGDRTEVGGASSWCLMRY
jgi:hypothetical protein